jgi:alpha-maltose-1-phosphate synthase
MRALIMTNEYPPNVYGGAGVHVEYLTRELARLIDVDVRTFGEQDQSGDHLAVKGYDVAHELSGADAHVASVLAAFSRDLSFVADPVDADVVHCHTWYTHLGGIVAKLAYGIPLVVTVHSLEPLRPWKREQLRGGYDVSTWVERTALEMADAVVAVSKGTRDDILRLFDVSEDRITVIANGIDTEEYRRTEATDALERLGIDPNVPYVLFVGRITRQKGIIHLVRAIRHLDRGFAVVLCAGAPDTPEIAAEMNDAVAEAQATRPDIHWIAEMVDKPTVRQLYSHAAVFACPSIYEPFGLINLEAMACETPVVASAVGGIPEVVVDGETGLLVPFDARGDDGSRFQRDFAGAINALVKTPARREAMGRAGRRRAVERFGWGAIARQTIDVYRSVQRASASTSPGSDRARDHLQAEHPLPSPSSSRRAPAYRSPHAERNASARRAASYGCSGGSSERSRARGRAR